MTEALDIRHNENESRFETNVGGGVAFTKYERSGDSYTFTHTEVPEQAGGQGVGGRVVKHALDHAKREGWTVVPQCAFVKGYIEKHPEYRDLVKT